ncbi:MmcQ/YjbR family DNA-binding protein [Phycicoccus ginsengisoli]
MPGGQEVPDRTIHDGSPLARVRALCLALPATEERTSHGEATWFAGGRKAFVMAADRHHDDRVAVWAAAPEGVQEALVAEDPDRWFRPPYVGHRGWVGAWLDVDVDWERLEDVVDDAWRRVAPARLVAQHDAAGPAGG